MEKAPRFDTVSSAGARDIFKVCVDEGLLSKERMQQLQLSDDTFTQPDARLAESTLIGLWQILHQHRANSGFGLTLGQTIAPESKGILASWVSQANTLREALDIFFENIALMNPSERWQIDESQSECTLTLTIDPDKAYPPNAIERSMSAMVTWARALSGHPFPISQASFSFGKPDYVDMFAPIFGSHIRFNEVSNRLSFSTALLELPILSSNQLLKSLIEEKAALLLSSLSQNATLSEKLEALILDAISQSKTLSTQQVGDILGMSRQTLYRKLKQEGTDFKSIYDHVRRSQALKLLKAGKDSINTVSLQLGFKDPSSFYKAFQRWTGVSPKRYTSGDETL